MYWGLRAIGIPDLGEKLKQIDLEKTYIPESSLTTEEKDNLQRAKNIIQMATEKMNFWGLDYTRPRPLKLDYPCKIFTSKSMKAIGYSNSYNGEIGIHQVVLKSLPQTCMVLLEEAIHYEYGLDDVTAQFQQIYVQASGSLVSFLMREYKWD